MEIIDVNAFEMKDMIEEGTLISDKGFSGAIFLHDSTLIKLSKRLYQDLKVNSRTFAERRFKDIYRFEKKPFVEKEQIEFLQEKQKDIHLTDFDKGIVSVNDLICGTILTPHLDYQDLTDIDLHDKKTLLIILGNILKAIKELEKNGISHLDLAKGESGKKPTLNILHKGTDIKLCDLSGKYITYNDGFDPVGMYQEYSIVFNILMQKLYGKNIEQVNIENYEQATEKLAKLSK